MSDASPIEETLANLRAEEGKVAKLWELVRLLEAEQARADDEIATLREVNAAQAARLAAYQQDARERMARSGE